MMRYHRMQSYLTLGARTKSAFSTWNVQMSRRGKASRKFNSAATRLLQIILSGSGLIRTFNLISSFLGDSCLTGHSVARRTTDHNLHSCCIDKKSSAELSEAINSMYRWYNQAVTCYAFLADVSWTGDAVEIEAQLKSSRWFKRGWTLQELIAPRTVVFFSSEWRSLGTKSQLTSALSFITGIDPDYLEGKDVKLASISKRMFWASSRNTTRTEDIAYCLLGIFDINMPLLYGEGKRAFRRLQEEILKVQPYEHTLFAWGEVILPSDIPNIPTFFGEKEFNEHGQDLCCNSDAESPFLGLLAESPADFKDTGCLVPNDVANHLYSSPHSSLAIPISMNNGHSIELPRYYGLFSHYGCVHWKTPRLVQLWARDTLALLCRLENSFQTESYILIPIWIGDKVASRSRYLILERSPVDHVLYDMLPTRKKSFIGPQPRMEIVFRTGDSVFLRPPAIPLAARECSKLLKMESWTRNVERTNKLVFRLRENLRSRHLILQWCFQQKGNSDKGWIAILYREWLADSSLGPLQISIVRVSWRGVSSGQIMGLNMEVHWYPFPSRNGRGDFIAGEWPLDTNRPCCSHVMTTPKDSWEVKGGREMPIFQISTERRVMDNGAVVDLIDFQAPNVKTD
jgi:hypothetical protein